jgi:cytoskeletal protein RodZ
MSMTKVNLRQERELRNISVKELSHQARIPIQFIEALETGIIPQKLRGPILLSYKKKYLLFLDLPQDSKLRFRTTKRKIAPSRSGHRTRTILTTTTNGIRQPSTIQSMAIGFSLAVICVVSLKLLSSVLESTSKQEIASTQVTAEPIKKESAETDKKYTQSSLKSSWLDDFVTQTVSLSEAHAAENKQEDYSSLSLYATDETKVRFYCDSKLLHSGFLKRGKKHLQNCKFNEEVSIWIKDISRVKIYFNKRLIRPMGPQDTPRTLNFTSRFSN